MGNENASRQVRNGDIVELLVAKGADVNSRDKSGDTPLHAAALWGNYEAAKSLLAKGADVNARDKNGHTPLGWMPTRKTSAHEEITALLVSKGGKE